MASIYGKKLKLSVFGESHGEAIGVVLDGFPAGMKVDFDAIAAMMKRRAPGSANQSLAALSTKRSESDIPRILSGVSDGYTNGFPICAVIENENQRSSDYKNITGGSGDKNAAGTNENSSVANDKNSVADDRISVSSDRYSDGSFDGSGVANDKNTAGRENEPVLPRPNHADYPAFIKYGMHTELRGGGHFSGRLTAPLVFAGAMCMQLLALHGIEVAAHVRQILNVSDSRFDLNVTPELLRKLRQRSFPTLDKMSEEAFTTIINSAKMRGDSVGAIIECAVAGEDMPVALGEHMFDSVEAEISNLAFAIPGVKGIEFGAGFDFCRLYGSEANDAYEYRDGKVVTKTNNCGGIVGGMTTGMPIVFSVVMKPTPSIYIEQDTVDLAAKADAKLTIEGRHDPCIALRAVPVVESAAAIALAGLLLDAGGRKL